MISFNCDAEDLSKLLGFPLPPCTAVMELCFDSDNTCGLTQIRNCFQCHSVYSSWTVGLEVDVDFTCQPRTVFCLTALKFTTQRQISSSFRV